MAKWIKFIRAKDIETGKTEIWSVLSIDGGHHLGSIKWFGQWRKYSFFPASNIVLEQDCLRDIADKIDELMINRRAQKMAESMIAEH